MASHHGNTPAAWTAVVIGLVGSIVAGVGSIIPSLLITLVGLAVMLGGLLIGYVMGRVTAGAETGSAASRTGH